MTALVSSSLTAIFTAASFFRGLVLCSIPAYPRPQDDALPVLCQTGNLYLLGPIPMEMVFELTYIEYQSLGAGWQCV